MGISENGHQRISFFTKNLLKANQVKNNRILDQAVYSNNELRNTVIRREILEIEKANKINDIVEEVLNLHNQQSKGLS